MTLPSRIKDLPQHERPRERLAEHGAEALTDAQLIAILLRTGVRGQSAVDVGRALIQRFGTLSEMSRASLEEIREILGVGRDKAIALKTAFTLARRMEWRFRRPHRYWINRRQWRSCCERNVGRTPWSIFMRCCSIPDDGFCARWR